MNAATVCRIPPGTYREYPRSKARKPPPLSLAAEAGERQNKKKEGNVTSEPITTKRQ